jgi:hypothetical protein
MKAGEDHLSQRLLPRALLLLRHPEALAHPISGLPEIGHSWVRKSGSPDLRGEPRRATAPLLPRVDSASAPSANTSELIKHPACRPSNPNLANSGRSL